ncbi:hypothetical protein [Floridanema evergladense]|uniref:Uncharacterized protein n=1 Tax=Floridaenema evergladense BLCC-F167 TaxID=3153639 RepID=A0ABV4WIY2_9CYAN
MEDWQKNWFAMLETMVDEVEKFLDEVLGEVSQAVSEASDVFVEAFDAFTKNPEEFVNQLQGNINLEFEQFFTDIFEPGFLDFDEIHFESDWPITDWVEPSADLHPACIGCRHFHGQMYGGNLLVCGMHPYGCEGETCPDWEEDLRGF